MSGQRWVSYISLFLLILVGVLIAILVMSRVDDSLTTEDRHYIAVILGPTGLTIDDREPSHFGAQLVLIQRIQAAVLQTATKDVGIPLGHPREPKNVYMVGRGLCYDRSRVIEKALRYAGFTTRHISIYSKTESSLKALFTPHVSSHAITEAKTAKGWLVVDSNDPWISLDKSGRPISITGIQENVGVGGIAWKSTPPSPIYQQPFVFVYGLYSRHGEFYPPYNRIPDINYREFAQNFL